MAILTLEELLSPFEFLDIGGIYERYSSAIDFTIAFLLFLGIAKVTLGRRFEGRGGKLIVTSVALALSVGFSLMEQEMHFSLRSFGAFGAFFLIFWSRSYYSTFSEPAASAKPLHSAWPISVFISFCA